MKRSEMVRGKVGGCSGEARGKGPQSRTARAECCPSFHSLCNNPCQARSDASKVSKEWLEHLADITKTPTSQLKFINEAWNQVGDTHARWTGAGTGRGGALTYR